MYQEFFGLQAMPFTNTPDTHRFFEGGHRGETLAALLSAVAQGEGVIKVVGEVGSGKTMLCRMMEKKLPDSVDVVYLANPSLTRDRVLHAIAMELKLVITPSEDPWQTLHLLQRQLIEKHAQNRQVVVLIEEAQDVPLTTLEEICRLGNLETEQSKLLQVVLFGQPELDINLEGLRALQDRITSSFPLQPLSREETSQYLAFRLWTFGYQGRPLFDPEAIRAIHEAAGGLIRRINTLAHQSMLAAYRDHARRVGRRQVQQAFQDSDLAPSAPAARSPKFSLWHNAPMAMATAFGLTMFLSGGLAHWGYLAYSSADSGQIQEAARSPGLPEETPALATAQPSGENLPTASQPMPGAQNMAMASETTAPPAHGGESGPSLAADRGETPPAVVPPTTAEAKPLTPPAPSKTAKNGGEHPHHDGKAEQADTARASATATAAAATLRNGKTAAVTLSDPVAGSSDAHPAEASIPSYLTAAYQGILEERLAASRQWLQTMAHPTGMTIQLLTANQHNILTMLHNLFGNNSPLDRDLVYIFQDAHHRYVVYYNTYADPEISLSSLYALPASLQKGKPALVEIQKVHDKFAHQTQEFAATTPVGLPSSPGSTLLPPAGTSAPTTGTN